MAGRARFSLTEVFGYGTQISRVVKRALASQHLMINKCQFLRFLSGRGLNANTIVLTSAYADDRNQRIEPASGVFDQERQVKLNKRKHALAQVILLLELLRNGYRSIEMVNIEMQTQFHNISKVYRLFSIVM